MKQAARAFKDLTYRINYNIACTTDIGTFPIFAGEESYKRFPTDPIFVTKFSTFPWRATNSRLPQPFSHILPIDLIHDRAESLPALNIHDDFQNAIPVEIDEIPERVRGWVGYFCLP